MADDLCPVMLSSGKGGVGKTTLAAATAVRLARMGSRVLVMSTDPAHSLAASLDTPLDGQPRTILPGLDAMEVDAKGMFSEAVRAMEKQGSAPGPMRDLMRMVSETPGVDEFGAIEVLLQAMEHAEHDVVILDTAPTGHTLKLLTVPQLMDTWFGKLLEMRRGIAKAGRLLRKILPGVEAAPDAEALGEDLEGGRKRIGTLKDVLTDPERAQILLVTIPEAMGIEETRRTLARLAEGGMPVGTVVVNHLQPDSPGCTHCQRRREIHLKELARMRRLAGHCPVRVVEAQPKPIRGLEDLAVMGELLWGDAPSD